MRGKNNNTFLIMFIISFCITSCETVNQQINNTIFDIPEGLPPLAIASLEYLPLIADNNQYFQVINRNINSLIIKNRPNLASQLLEQAVTFVQENYTDIQQVDSLINIARIYIDVESVNTSVSLLESAFIISLNFEDGREKNELIQEIIDVLIIIGNDGIALLQRIVLEMYTIKNYELRSNMLIDTAMKYQENGDTARILLQQAIPAITSIENNLVQSLEFSHLALLFYNEEDYLTAQRYYQKSLDIINTMDFTNFNDTEQSILADIIQFFARGGYFNDANRLSEFIIKRGIYFNQLIEIARSYFRREQIIDAESIISDITSMIDIEIDEEEAVQVLIRISQLYFDFDNQTVANVYATNAEELALELVVNSQQNFALYKVFLHFASIGNYERALAIAERITDRNYLIPAYLDFVQIRFRNLDSENGNEELESNTETVANDTVTETIQNLLNILETVLALEISPENEELYSELAIRFAELGSVERALEIVPRITDSYLRAISLAEIYSFTNSEQENIEINEELVSRI